MSGNAALMASRHLACQSDARWSPSPCTPNTRRTLSAIVDSPACQWLSLYHKLHIFTNTTITRITCASPISSGPAPPRRPPRGTGVARSRHLPHATRFATTVGCAPMEYLSRWRMSLAQDALSREGKSLDRVAEEIGYDSASAFSTAFRRRLGCAPGAFARSRRVSKPALRRQAPDHNVPSNATI
ncbi:MAG: helix-turn-helix transcriptional regulator [Rhizobiales bacterium]|nr:helix-turn-helix transcriptional regulator [Hyphomicrobiales bacterium]MBP9173332.1 helix-turn-helix transcriptional regulator [Hyphomicrobiales bacterium]